MLSGLMIISEIENGNIGIEPFDKKYINPNSYNIRLGNKMLIYKEEVLDLKIKPETEEITIPDDGIILEPGNVYLVASYERTRTDKYVPMIEGRSGIGRMGLFIHASACFGDVGYDGHWTFQLVPTRKIKVYPYVPVAQLYFHTLEGDYELYGKVKSNPLTGKYLNSDSPKASKLYEEFK